MPPNTWRPSGSQGGGGFAGERGGLGGSVNPQQAQQMKQVFQNLSQHFQGLNTNVGSGPVAGGNPSNASSIASGVWALVDIQRRMLAKIESGVGTQMGSDSGGGGGLGKALQGYGQGLNKTMGGIFSSSPLQGVGNVAEGSGQAIGSMLGLFNPALGLVVEKFGELAGTIPEFVDQIRNMGRELLNANLALAEFSGAMAQVAAESQLRDIERSMRKGEARAGSATQLMEAQQNLEDALEPIENAFANWQNEQGAMILEDLTKLVNVGRSILEWLGVMDAKQEKQKEDDLLTNNLKEITQAWDAQHGRPQRFPSQGRDRDYSGAGGGF